MIYRYEKLCKGKGLREAMSFVLIEWTHSSILRREDSQFLLEVYKCSKVHNFISVKQKQILNTATQ